MKRNIRTIIIVAVLLVLLSGMYLFVRNLEKSDKEENSNLTTEQIEYIISDKPEEISYVQYNTGEVNYTVYSGEAPTIEGYTSHIIDPSKLETLLMSTATMQFSKNMGKQSDLSKYGLDREDKFVLFKLKNGDERRIILGNPTHLNGEYYARKAGDNVVYTLSSQASALLLSHPGIFRDTTVCVIDNYSISDFSVTKSGIKVLEVKRDDEFAKSSGFIQSNFILKYPYNNVEANNDTINNLFGYLSSVYATEIVEENPTELVKYGLDKPNTVTVQDDKGVSTVKMGKYADDGTVYVMRDDVPVVFKAVCPFYEPVKTLIPDEFVARYIHIFKLTDIESVRVESPNESHTMKITEKSTDTYEYRIDDKIKSEDNFRAAYETVIMPIANKIVNEEIEGEEVCRITFTFKNQSVKTFVYSQYDDNNYIVKADNGLVCLVKKESVDKILKSLK